jgi:hypothetical protein
LQKDVLKFVDPSSALLLSVVAAKMATNLVSWTAATVTNVLSPQTQRRVVTKALKEDVNVKACLSLLAECENKISIAKQTTSGDAWLLYSLEDLKDDIKDALRNDDADLLEDVVEFRERMDSIIEDYCSSGYQAALPISSSLDKSSTLARTASSFVCALPAQERLVGRPLSAPLLR